MKIKKIIIIADILRHHGGQDGNADMFYGLLSGILRRISNIPCKLFTASEQYDIQVRTYNYYGFNICESKVESTIFGGVPSDWWRTLCFSEPNAEFIKLIEQYFKDCLVICREPSPLFIKAFKILHIPYVELAIHSVRFTDDLIMGITSSEKSVYEKIKKFEMDKEEIYYYVNLLKAEAMRKYSYNYFPLAKNSAVFFGQTPVDRSLLDYENKNLVSLFTYKDKFKELTEKYSKVYYKPHPHYTDERVIDFIKSFSNTEILDEKYNTYDLLSSCNIECCAAISSGTLNEARFFGKEIECFLKQPYIYSDEIDDKRKLDKDKHYITIARDYLTAHFWAEILRPIIKTKSVKPLMNLNYTNKMRRIIGSTWGYNDNDSQFVAKNLS